MRLAKWRSHITATTYSLPLVNIIFTVLFGGHTECCLVLVLGVLVPDIINDSRDLGLNPFSRCYVSLLVASLGALNT